MSADVILPQVHLSGSFSNSYQTLINRFGGSDTKARGIGGLNHQQSVTASLSGPHALPSRSGSGRASSVHTLDSPRPQALSIQEEEAHIWRGSRPQESPHLQLRAESGGLRQTVIRDVRGEWDLGIQAPRTSLGVRPVPPPLPEDCVCRNSQETARQWAWEESAYSGWGAGSKRAFLDPL